MGSRWLHFPLPSSDWTATGIMENVTVGESVSFGHLLYLKSDGKWWKADANAGTTMPGTRLALETKNADDSCLVLRYGRARAASSTWGLTVGGESGLLYASAAVAGSFTNTAPSGAQDRVQRIGYAYTADAIVFEPSTTIVEVR